MSDADQCETGQTVGDDLHQFRLTTRVKRGRRLVEYQDVGPMDQHAREGEPLPLAFRQSGGPGQVGIEPRQEAPEPDRFERVGDPVGPDAFRRQRIGDRTKQRSRRYIGTLRNELPTQ